MKFILGKKLEMGQKFDESGTVVPVTMVQAGPCVVTQIRTNDRDGYAAIQVGFGEKKSLSKALSGHLKDLGNKAIMKEFRLADEQEAEKVKRGDTITATIFEKGEIVEVTGTSKGKGFQGVVKRHGFKGAKKTHGTKDQLRMPGSVGATGPAHVFKGTRMGGRMGGDQVTVTNLQIVDIDTENNILFIKGAIPGGRNTVVSISSDGELDLSKKPQAEEEVASVEGSDAPAETTEDTAGESPKTETPVEEKKEDVATEVVADESTEEAKVEEAKVDPVVSQEPKEENTEETK